MAKQIVCNWCGSAMSEEEENNEVNLHTYLGYGTKYDGKTFELDLCLKCAEEFIEMIENIVVVSALR